MPRAIPVIPIFTMGLEMLFLPLFDKVILFAMNCSTLTIHKNTI